jgi:DNA-binding FadR family transcriptional regulator
MSRLHEHVMRVLIVDIAGGRVAPGEALPREADLAVQFGVSRGVARECLRGLEERGLVQVKHGRGATVAAADRWNVFDPDVLGALLQSEQAGAILDEYLESRRILEIEAVGLAAERATEGDLAALSTAFARMCASAERARGNPAAEDLYHEADIAFHRALMAATGNRALGRMIEPIHRALAAARRPPTWPERAVAEHRRVLAAVADRDPEAARAAMRDHLVTVEDCLRNFSQNGAEDTDSATR